MTTYHHDGPASTGCGHLDEARYVESPDLGRRLEIRGWFLFPEPWTILQFSADGKRFYAAHRTRREDLAREMKELAHAKDCGYFLELPADHAMDRNATILFRVVLANGLAHAGKIIVRL